MTAEKTSENTAEKPVRYPGQVSKAVAVDVVLLPPKEIAGLCVKLSRKLNEISGDDSVTLSLTETIPHISLAMGAVDPDAVGDLGESLSLIGDRYLPYTAAYKDFAVVKTSENVTVSGMNIVKDDIITGMRSDVVSALKEFNLGSVTSEMVFPDRTPITQFTLDYSSNYIKNADSRRFSPHITLGNGDVNLIRDMPAIPQSFTCTDIAVCHLGNHCTCKKILWHYED